MNLLISTEQNKSFLVAVGEREIFDFKIVKKEYAQSELLLKTIEELARNQENKKTRNQAEGARKGNKQAKNNGIERIFVVSGPGAFAALRVGIATANALAYAWGVPVVGIQIKDGWELLSEEERLKKIWQVVVRKSTLINFNKPSSIFVSPSYGKEPHIMEKRKIIK